MLNFQKPSIIIIISKSQEFFQIIAYFRYYIMRYETNIRNWLGDCFILLKKLKLSLYNEQYFFFKISSRYFCSYYIQTYFGFLFLFLKFSLRDFLVSKKWWYTFEKLQWYLKQVIFVVAYHWKLRHDIQGDRYKFQTF